MREKQTHVPFVLRQHKVILMVSLSVFLSVVVQLSDAIQAISLQLPQNSWAYIG